MIACDRVKLVMKAFSLRSLTSDFIKILILGNSILTLCVYGWGFCPVCIALSKGVKPCQDLSSETNVWTASHIDVAAGGENVPRVLTAWECHTRQLAAGCAMAPRLVSGLHHGFLCKR